MLLVSLGTLAFQWPLGWISDRRDRRKAILLSSGVGAGSAFVLAVLQPAGPLLFGGVLLFGGFAMPLYSLGIALLNDRLSREDIIQAVGALVIFYGIGSACGPILGGIGMGFLGPRGLFAVMALLLLLYIGVALLTGKRPSLRRRSATRFRLYPRTTIAAFSLLRRVRPRRGTKGAESGTPSQEM
jgi:MFS family permease